MADDIVKSWVVTADMGLGHQRAVWPFLKNAEGGIITLETDEATSESEKLLWKRVRSSYELLSRLKNVPLAGKKAFGILDYLLNIPPLYPIRNRSHSSFQVKFLKRLINKGLCEGVLKKASKKPLPFMTSFYAPAIAAENADFLKIYCIICDSDLNRVWVAGDPYSSRIEYFVPCTRAAKRLNTYGVPDSRIYITGFPLPVELLGGPDLGVLKKDLGKRLCRLDPEGRFRPLHERNVEHFLGKENYIPSCPEQITIMFSVGGAGAQKEIGSEIAQSFRDKIRNGKIRLLLSAGTKREVYDYFLTVKKDIDPGGKGVSLIFSDNREEYFRMFNERLHETDILWTKPSELSFYSALGLPVIISPDIGPQERYNKKWLLETQAGLLQEDPKYADQWLTDLVRMGRLAECAWSGFLKGRKYGTYRILEVLSTGAMKEADSPLRR
ncbi:MAG: DUF6938 domain-containing protein [Fibrobacterota bacterium]